MSAETGKRGVIRPSDTRHISRHCAVSVGNDMIRTELTPPSVGCERIAARFRREVSVCVLLVEDEPIILMATAFCLEGAGFQVMTADHGLHALELLEQDPGHFTALVTDLHMPLVTGTQVVMSMRRNYASIPMIITTARTHGVAEDWRLRYGVDVLAKPYDPETLISMLKAVLNP